MIPAGLTPKREKFAQRVVSGMTQADAYRAAFGGVKGSPKTVQEAASRLMADSKVAARVAELRKPVVAAVRITLESHLRDLLTLRNMAAKDGQISAAVRAEEARGKASGLYTDKVEHSNPDGSLRPTLIQIVAKR